MPYGMPGQAPNLPAPGTTYSTNPKLANYPMSGIEYPGLNDIMCGRGGGTNNHIGNIRFRQLVNEHKIRYFAASKSDKPKVAMEVVQIWRSLDPPGRFLAKTDLSMGDDSLWHDVGDKKAREKASQCLRERTPDIMPLVKQLQASQQQQKAAAAAAADKVGSTPQAVPSSNAKSDPSAMMPPPSSKADVVPSQVPSNASVKPSKSDSVPDAASLIQDVFGSDSDGGLMLKALEEQINSGALEPNAIGNMALSIEEYQADVAKFLENAPQAEGADAYGDDRSHLMETLSTASSWIKSFKSVDTASMMTTTNNSLHGIMEEGRPGADNPSNLRELPSFNKESQTRSQRMKLGKSSNNAGSNISMLSDLSDISKAKSTRSMKMSHAGKEKSTMSNISMLSELTDLSSSMRDLEM